MKYSSIIIFATLLALGGQGYTQTAYKEGYVVTRKDEKMNGLIRVPLRTDGTLTFIFPDGKTKIFSPAELIGFCIGDTIYHSLGNHFYRMVSSGPRAILYQRITSPQFGTTHLDGVPVNHTKAMEGERGDYFLWMKADKSFTPLTKDNLEACIRKLADDYSGHEFISIDEPLKYLQAILAVKLQNVPGTKSHTPN